MAFNWKLYLAFASQIGEEVICCAKCGTQHPGQGEGKIVRALT